MMQPHGIGRMEEKHNMRKTHVCGSIAMHSTEMNCSGIKLDLIEQGLP